VKIVALVSGGIDSSVLLYYLKKHLKAEVVGVTFLYGQKHSKELESARKICKSLGVRHLTIDLSNLSYVFKSALTTDSIEIPEVCAKVKFHDTLKVTVVPNRNSIFVSIAAAYAWSIGYDTVAYAAHWSDAGVYPDCTVDYVNAMNETLYVATEGRVKLFAPFIDKDKKWLVSLGHHFKVPFKFTWSCYKGGKRHCGICSSCRERQRAFKESKIPDPTEYESL